MNTLHPKTLSFLKDLKKNNHRDWFLEHKALFDDVKASLEGVIKDVLHSMGTYEPMVLDLEAKKTIFRIYRDTRFSHDKTPYKTNIGAYISPSKVKNYAGYYIHIEPGASMLACGAYLPPTPWLQAIRQEIAYNTQEFTAIIESKDFKKHFKQLEGERLKTAPKGFEKDHPALELLKHKSFIGLHSLSDTEIFSKNFTQDVVKVFKAAKSLNDFMNRAAD